MYRVMVNYYRYTKYNEKEIGEMKEKSYCLYPSGFVTAGFLFRGEVNCL